jgi:hypothetical protein
MIMGEDSPEGTVVVLDVDPPVVVKNELGVILGSGTGILKMEEICHGLSNRYAVVRRKKEKKEKEIASFNPSTVVTVLYSTWADEVLGRLDPIPKD